MAAGRRANGSWFSYPSHIIIYQDPSSYTELTVARSNSVGWEGSFEDAAQVHVLHDVNHEKYVYVQFRVDYVSW